ncbi:MGDG synthase family glycosyltransferase [Paenibacillus sp. USDA918EY]|uniref:MGDG synthase family glycosyltransferase n=1 Tax=Paenibacillus sp. USDA918EY TaxID=2689575 RepID=UPI001F3BA29B|nr:UDP-N-acetylglucosamine 2-epimerase [Paenibacillus sp. USDA918EY]
MQVENIGIDQQASGGIFVNIRHPRILILTAGYGEGHLQVSRALKQGFLSKQIYDLHIVDLMKEAHPILNSVSSRLYRMSAYSSQLGLDYYGWSYYMTRDTSPAGSLHRYLNVIGKRKMLEMTESVRPDAIINTFPFGAVTETGRRFSIPTSTVITDYALHSRWVHPETDKYYVATETLKNELIRTYGVAQDRVRVTGIPVRTAFYHTANAAEASVSVETGPGRHRVLIMAGCFAVFHHVVELVQQLLRKEDCDIVLVCGRHSRMVAKLRSLFSNSPAVNVLGYVERLHELMASSACIVTKAGGVTLSEALVLKLPVFIFKPYGGQERENARFFKRSGLGDIAHDIRELGEKIVRFLRDPAASDRIRNNMTILHNGEAAEQIVEDTLLTIEEQRDLRRSPHFTARK